MSDEYSSQIRRLDQRGRSLESEVSDLESEVSSLKSKVGYRVYSQCTGLQPGGEANLWPALTSAVCTDL
ncbi:hypothetical protein, partial [Streptomyces sp. NPDC057580]|uniref:hypothetical protein n=1 Tax=Streptomyces sp. NPDC057580 TaxID=3346173 RepID=UPI0036C55463